ncbi:MAG TPA: cupredoxin domain-containing protein [Rhizomicrobium sp.]|nr:cupredoxin domain-containing protein [Rhizomicrobium sp.]
MTFIRKALAPLAFVSLLAAGPAFAQSAQEVDVALTSYAFTPSAFTLHANTTYRLHLVNSSRKGHNFAAPEFFAASTISPADAGKITSGAIEVDEGQTVDVTVTPTRAGSYDLVCSHFMHTMLGMKGKITVQ